MYCPFCNAQETKVVDSRLFISGKQVRRRRECIDCDQRFTTYEIAELTMPQVVKKDDTRVPFDLEKLRHGMQRALQKRPVGSEQIGAAVQRLLDKIRATGEQEISSRQIGEWVMEELRALDEVAYVRFASVYRQFQDVEAFHKEIECLRKQVTQN